MIVSAKNIQVAYESKVVFNHVSFDIELGQKVAITGESGKGKSTLLNVLAGFVPFQNGEIMLFDKSLSNENIGFIRQQLAWVPQETSLHFDSVKEILEAPFEFKSNVVNKPSSAEISEVFKGLNLSLDLLDKTPSTISGGQRQRILIASSLLLKKPLLIIDEPTSALDEANRKMVTDFILSHKDLTVIASTHDGYWMEQSDIIIEL